MLGLLEGVSSNFVLNFSILVIGAVIIAVLLLFRKKEIGDINKYNWDKFNIKWDNTSKYPSGNGKDKMKTRIKGYRKVIDLEREGSKFPRAETSMTTSSNMNEQYLSFEEGKKLQDMINYAVSIENKEDCTVQAVYDMVKENKKSSLIKNSTNEKIDSEIQYVLKR